MMRQELSYLLRPSDLATHGHLRSESWLSSSVLKYRAMCLVHSTLRAQLRWEFDPPPEQTFTVPATASKSSSSSSSAAAATAATTATAVTATATGKVVKGAGRSTSGTSTVQPPLYTLLDIAPPVSRGQLSYSATLGRLGKSTNKGKESDEFNLATLPEELQLTTLITRALNQIVDFLHEIAVDSSSEARDVWLGDWDRDVINRRVRQLLDSTCPRDVNVVIRVALVSTLLLFAPSLTVNSLLVYIMFTTFHSFIYLDCCCLCIACVCRRKRSEVSIQLVWSALGA